MEGKGITDAFASYSLGHIRIKWQLKTTALLPKKSARQVEWWAKMKEEACKTSNKAFLLSKDNTVYTDKALVLARAEKLRKMVKCCFHRHIRLVKPLHETDQSGCSVGIQLETIECCGYSINCRIIFICLLDMWKRMNVRQHGIQPAISQPLPCDSSEFILKILIQSILTLFNCIVIIHY